jgi:hypothetical protein
VGERSQKPTLLGAYLDVLNISSPRISAPARLPSLTLNYDGAIPPIATLNVDATVTEGWNLPPIDQKTWLEAMVEMNAAAKAEWDDPWVQSSVDDFFSCGDTALDVVHPDLRPDTFVSYSSGDGVGGSKFFGEVSGSALKHYMDQLTWVRNAQRALEARIEAAQKQWEESNKIPVIFPDGTSRTLVLSTLMRDLVVAKVRKAKVAQQTIRLVRCVRAIKRAMRRRQRIVLARFTQSERVWYLLHGTHPPEAQSIFNAEFLLRGGRA